MTDKEGNVIATYKYDAWGNMLESDESADVVAAGNRFKYQSNWMYLREGVYLSPARLYHARYGSFLQQDPLYKVGFLSHAFAFNVEYLARYPNRKSSAINLYQYIGSMPTKVSDSYGLYNPYTGQGWVPPSPAGSIGSSGSNNGVPGFTVTLDSFPDSSIKGGSIYLGIELKDTGELRLEYDKLVKDLKNAGLSKADYDAARDALKIEFRKKQTNLGKVITQAILLWRKLTKQEQ